MRRKYRCTFNKQKSTDVLLTSKNVQMYLYYCNQLGLIKEPFLMIWVPFLSPFLLLFQTNESQEILILAEVYIITKKMSFL